MLLFFYKKEKNIAETGCYGCYYQYVNEYPLFLTLYFTLL